MHILQLLLLGIFLAFAVAQSSVLYFTRVPNPITDGEEQVILWSTNDTSTPVTLKLLKGKPMSDESLPSKGVSFWRSQYTDLSR